MAAAAMVFGFLPSQIPWEIKLSAVIIAAQDTSVGDLNFVQTDFTMSDGFTRVSIAPIGDYYSF
jgi:hypothetical protein